RDTAKEAGARASAAEAKLKELERTGARRRQLEVARAESQSAQSEADAAKRELSRRTRRLDEVTGLLGRRQEEVVALERRRARLADQGKTLEAENAAARQRLTQAET